MNAITSYDKLDKLGRVRLSQNFYMRDFLYSEIAAWHSGTDSDGMPLQLRNVPDHPDLAIEAGEQLCNLLLEPLQATFGRINIRSGYRSPAVNAFGNSKGLNCGSNESNFGAHIWGYRDVVNNELGAMACIIIPWQHDRLSDHPWTEMAWWIHDHLPYSTLQFFASGAFNIGWQKTPQRVIRSTGVPQKLTAPGMTNHDGSHASEYPGYPELKRAA
ncbi:hypothetical protein J2X16_004387 [Pelomonas aquatica]|uniref:Peptidase M15 n=1 Tax=Pelomonas aquatica TaxID=431058 RepID=A0ABU1ZEG1_9BURK|nr:hypothetical protein [Pelomonas aquatica]MDR7299019.1 hypothetical protein [Pelomonas aquatica]